MRSSIFVAAPLVAAAYAASTVGTTTVDYLSGGKTVKSVYTYTYSNPATAFLTETNSAGVITGMPSGAAVMTSQPAVATIPAGLPKGETVITYNGTKGLESFSISVGASTTIVLGGQGVSASQSIGPSGGVANPKGGNGGGNGGASSSTTSGNAAPTGMKAASAGILGVGALVAALL